MEGFGPSSMEEICAEAMNLGSNLSVADTVAIAEGVEQDGFFRDQSIAIPIPHPILVGGIAACLVCGLRKCKTL